MNAVNMTDGIDGLAGSWLLVFYLTLLGLALNASLAMEANILLLLSVCIFVFLLFNFRIRATDKASVFLGDAGALFLGLATTWFLIRFSQPDYALMRPITAVWMVGLPLMDTVSIMVRRAVSGRSPFDPDREHFHHFLSEKGLSVRGSVAGFVLVNLGLSFVGLGGEWLLLPEWLMFYSFWTLFGLYYWTMSRFWRKADSSV
jgi:UDP-GlcNAc:undecaprenyl-phosphate GlcNAc-1-phosphate transferase